MPHVEDPEKPDQRIDVIELLNRYSNSSPPPNLRIIGALLKRDKWTRRDALLILAGFHPETALDSAGNPDPDSLAFLDGISWHVLRNIRPRRIHPRDVEATREYLVLADYSKGEDPHERRTPEEWLDWAEKKGFKPYWLEHWHDGRSKQAQPRPGISKAPPPITPLRGSGPAGIEEQTRPTLHAPPDWSKWGYILAPEDWQNVLLSLNIDPDRVQHSPQAWMYTAMGDPGPILTKTSFPSDAVRDKYKKRLSIIRSRRLPRATQNLAEFAGDALSFKWDIPDELRLMAQAAAIEPQRNGTGARRTEGEPTLEHKETAVTQANAAPMPTQRWQELEILRIIRDVLGHDPKALPKPEPGKPGVKAAVRAHLQSNHWRGNKFNKAWERLRSSNEIQDAP